MEHIINLDGIVTGFNVTETYIDCMCGKELLKIEKHFGDIICKKVINVPLRLSGRAYIENDFFFFFSRNILGIDMIKLNE